MSNEFVAFYWNQKKKSLSAIDKTYYNGRKTFYNYTTKGIGKAWKALKKSFNSSTTSAQAISFLESKGIEIEISYSYS